MQPFHPAVREWFESSFPAPTRPQRLGWPVIARGDSTLILAPTGSGKTLAAFLWCLNRLMFEPAPPRAERCRVLYISPLKALAVDVERNLRAPLAGIASVARERGIAVTVPEIVIEVAFDSIEKSARRKGGYGLRLPRVLRWRRDKNRDEADTLDRVRELYEASITR